LAFRTGLEVTWICFELNVIALNVFDKRVWTRADRFRGEIVRRRVFGR
jgi:hypothetical protein